MTFKPTHLALFVAIFLGVYTPYAHGSSVELTLAGESLAETLSTIVPVEFTQGVDKKQPVIGDYKASSTDSILTAILSPRGLTYTIDKGKYLITLQPKVAPVIRNYPLSVALDLILAGKPFRCEEGANPDIQVNFSAHNLSLDDALTQLVATKGYRWRRDGNAYVIYRDSEELFSLDFLPLTQKFNVSSSRQSSGSLNSSGNSGNNFSTNSGTSNYSGGLSASTGTASTEASVSTTDAILATVRDMLTKNGKVSINKEMRTLWIKDEARSVERVRGFVETMNARASRTVLIEGMITEVALNQNHEVGVDWRTVIGKLSATTAMADMVNSPAMLLDFAWGSSTEGLIVKALSEFGDVRVVSKPSLLIVNGSIGSLIAGDTVSYVAQAYASNYTLANSTSSLIVQPLQVGLSFYALPQVISDDEALIYIAPDLATLQEIRVVSNNDLTVEAPRITQKQTQALIRVKNGQKVLISGMMAENEKTIVKGVPVLKDIPVLGNLFSYEKKERTKSEFSLILNVKW